MTEDTNQIVLASLLDQLEASVRQLDTEVKSIATILRDQIPQTDNVTEYDKFLHSLFITALEGGIGYWSECEWYHWYTEETGSHDYLGFFADIRDHENLGAKYRIDREVMDRGYSIAHEHHGIYWSKSSPPAKTSPMLRYWDFDAGDADCIVQLGLFGKVIYG